MTETQYKQVTEALVNFITRVGNGKIAFTDEVMQLPEVVRVLMDFDARTPKAKAIPRIAFITPSDINDSHSFSDLKAENKVQASLIKVAANAFFETLAELNLIADGKFEKIINELEDLYSNYIKTDELLELFGKQREVEVQINTGINTGKEEKTN